MTASPNTVPFTAGNLIEFAQRKQALIARMRKELGEGWDALDDKAKDARIRELASQHHYFMQGGFWKEVFHGADAFNATGHDCNDLAQMINYSLMQFPQLCIDDAGNSATPEKAQISAIQLRAVFNNDRLMQRPVRNICGLILSTKWGKAPMQSHERDILTRLPRTNWKLTETAFAHELKALMESHTPIIALTDIVDNALKSDRKGLLSNRFGGHGGLSRALGRPDSVTLQSLHLIMLGLEDCGVPRGTQAQMDTMAGLDEEERMKKPCNSLAELAGKLHIPYDVQTGCVLPTIHEVIRDIDKNERTQPAQLLRALRTARDINLSEKDCAVHLQIKLDKYLHFENPTSRNKGLLDSYTLDRLFDLFDQQLGKSKLNVSERDAVQRVMERGYTVTTVGQARGERDWTSSVRRNQPLGPTGAREV